MAGIYSHKKGKSGSKRPYRLSAPTWVRLKPKEIETIVVKLYKGGLTTSKIGAKLRDEYGIPSVKLIEKKNILKILADAGIKPEVPEDLFSLMRRAVLLHKHLDQARRDLHSRKGLQDTEMKIWRLVKYYKKAGVLPANWKYTPDTAALLVSGG